MGTITTVSVGNGNHAPLASLVFAEMVKRAGAVQVEFQGDLFHDAITLDALLPRVAGQGITFYWSTRPSGTHFRLGEDGRDLLCQMARHSRGSTVYRFDVREDGRPLRWMLTVERIWYHG